MSILCHIALRMILQFKTPENALRMGKKLSEVFCTNSSMRSEEDFFKRCLMSTFLLRCLQKAEYFGRRMTESAEPTSAEVEIGALLFTYLQSLQFNAHEIYETVTSGHKFVKSKISYIGVGIYEVGAMFNHECYPSVMRYFNGSSLIFNTIRPHASGDVIAENYGPIFTKQTVGERQRSLASRYWFKCECRACKENWPVLEKLSNKCRLKCTTEHCEGTFNFPQNPRMMIAKCGKCKQNVSLEVPLNVLNEAEEMFREGAEAMDVNFHSISRLLKHLVFHSRSKTFKGQLKTSKAESKCFIKWRCLHTKIFTLHRSHCELALRQLEIRLTLKKSLFCDFSLFKISLNIFQNK